jgi:hypothetical protein
MIRKNMELKNYPQKDLMEDLNNMMIRIKVHLFLEAGDLRLIRYSKPNATELDSLTNRLMAVLKQDNSDLSN